MDKNEICSELTKAMDRLERVQRMKKYVYTEKLLRLRIERLKEWLKAE